MSALDPRRSWIGFLAVAGVVLTLALAWLQPASSEGLGALPRLVFWGAHTAAALVLLSVTQLAVSRARRLGAAPPFVQVSLAGLFGAALFAPVALGLDRLFLPLGAGLADDPRPVTALVEEFISLAPPLWLIWLLLNAPRLVQLGQDAPAAAPQPASREAGVVAVSTTAPGDDPDQDPALREFWARVPARLGRDIVALTAELHYLRVHTTQGDTLILMSFGRAVDALGAERGVQIHRSHWVSLRHVAALERQDGKAMCVLDTGLRLPVSRANRAAASAAIEAATSRP
jgi:hypothetical protein